MKLDFWGGGGRSSPLSSLFSILSLQAAFFLGCLVFNLLVLWLPPVAKSFGEGPAARSAMAMQTGEEGAQLGRLRPMCEIRGELLNDLVPAVREALSFDDRILCDSCLLCAGRETIRLLPFGWHAENNEHGLQLCSGVLSRVSGLCNECIRKITDTRVVQHSGLTPDGLNGMR